VYRLRPTYRVCPILGFLSFKQFFVPMFQLQEVLCNIPSVALSDLQRDDGATLPSRLLVLVTLEAVLSVYSPHKGEGLLEDF
jgi:hypothetical protein